LAGHPTRSPSAIAYVRYWQKRTPDEALDKSATDTEADIWRMAKSGLVSADLGTRGTDIRHDDAGEAGGVGVRSNERPDDDVSRDLRPHHLPERSGLNLVGAHRDRVPTLLHPKFIRASRRKRPRHAQSFTLPMTAMGR
jgi:hypothetical protein